MSDFLHFCRGLGIRIDTVPPVGVWKRYPTDDKPRKLNGAVRYFGTYGFAQNHALMTEPAFWQDDKPSKPLSRAEIVKREQEAAERRKNELRARIEAVASCRRYFGKLPSLRGEHPYLDRKGLSMRGCEHLKRDGDLLVIPMFANGRLMSVQTISIEGEKKFRYRCPIKGASYELRRARGLMTCFCEGFATGLTLYQSIPTASVVVCFNSSNLVDVAKTRKTAGMAVICADNDHETTHNPGITKGKEAAEILKCGLAYPEGICGTDWDDARQEWGERAYTRIRAEVTRNLKMVT
ncbi:toprim domain-containing protein [Oxalobacter paraformigenes]|uniref:Toprim domain-containing protein n=1 Tax=Oxalobacter paraformigenes TaxID=556268 RepID=C3X1S5_9BURK|nr:toprim domain-containing protein [Oxalobacter paraformigenes]EEO27161.2 hypothetical protein OFAG_00314 [Oxalobacter paraformigenes]